MLYRYLIICDGQLPAVTHWYDYDNNYNSDLNMVVFDFAVMKYTEDGLTWLEIQEDHL